MGAFLMPVGKHLKFQSDSTAIYYIYNTLTSEMIVADNFNDLSQIYDELGWKDFQFSKIHDHIGKVVLDDCRDLLLRDRYRSPWGVEDTTAKKEYDQWCVDNLRSEYGMIDIQGVTYMWFASPEDAVLHRLRWRATQ